MANLMDSFYDNAMSEAIEGSFKAVCLSGIRTGDNSKGGTDANDASENLGYLEVVVRPLTSFGEILPDPATMSDPVLINQVISLHASTFLARSDFELKDTDPPFFGQVLNCYFENGSVVNSDFRGLRFSESKSLEELPEYKALATIEGVSILSNQDWSQASLLGAGSLNTSSESKTSPSQAAFIEKLGSALKSKGLPFKVTDRSRTVDDQMQRILNKYRNNGPEEVVSTYGKNRGTAMVNAIRTGDQATFRQLASKSSRHLKGNAIDIRSWHYTNEQMTIVLQEIRKLGGNPLVENIEGCWTKSGRNVTVTQRVAGAKPGGRGKNTPCHNEHIHIDIPENYGV